MRSSPARRLTRRDVLRGFGVAGAGTLTLLLSACSSAAPTPTATSAPAAAAPTAAPTTASAAPTSAPTAAPTTAAVSATATPASQAAATPTAASNTSLSIPKGFDIHLLQWSSFVAEADAEIKRQAADFGKQYGGTVTIDIVNGNDLQAKVSAAVQSQSGPDIIQMEYNWPWLYSDACIDLSEEAKTLETKFGGYYDFMKSYSLVNGKWLAIPYTVVSNAWTYRTDWWKEATGSDKFPETLDDLYTQGVELKKAGHPLAQAMGHAYGDANTMWYGTLWNFGGQEVDEDGKTVKINSPETEAALAWAAKMYKDTFDPSVLSWDDSSNNRAYLAQTIAATQNGASIYIVAKQKYADIAKVTNNAVEPKGPKSNLPGYEIQLNFEHAVMKWSKYQDAAKAFIVWLMQPAQFSKWLGQSAGYNVGPLHYYDDDPVWNTDPKLNPFKDAIKASRWPGWPASPSRQAAEALSKYIIVDMFAKVAQGTTPKDAMTWAESQLKPIYGG